MSRNLVIVESPAKAKTIAKFLGSDYQIKSSFGHIRDLPKNELGVDVDNDFTPKYQTSPDKKKVVSELKKAAKGHTVWLASDEDREGEAIAWHVCHVLDLDPSKTNRIVFHEITKPAITAAVAKPRTIDMKLVDAQQARRILDRLVGYELSPVLWKKVRTGLSAGRVQSVAVKLIVEREREIKAFAAESSFKVTAILDANDSDLPAELSEKLADKPAAKEFLNHAASADFTVASVDQKPGSRNPGAPFTTSSLQQEAARRLGFSVRQTMITAQRLYENGHITYMRTDSTSLSPLAVNAAKTYITREYGEKYSTPRQFKTKSQAAQEAHEAIRPSDLSRQSAGADSSQHKLYELIWRRMLSSQMAPAKIEKTEIKIDIGGHSAYFLAVGEVLVFDGFLKVYGGSKDDRILPAVAVGQKLDFNSITALQTFSRPSARYSEAALVKKLEQLGIGRPSTYAPTISTIQDRGYVEKSDLEGESRQLDKLNLSKNGLEELKETVTVGADRAKLLPTPLAEIVTDFLDKYFSEVMNYEFTAQAEDLLDQIAEGKLAWQEMLRVFYKNFHPLVEKSADASKAETVKARELGTHPETKQPIIVRFGRFGPVLQMGEVSESKTKDAPKPRFAPLPEGTTLEDVTIEQAIPMFNLPRVVGKTEDGEEITADIGRFGPYIKVGGKYVSIKQGDPLTITEAEAHELIAQKAQEVKDRVIADWGKIKILRGPYGPYITDGKKNARIPKDLEPAKITKEEAAQILEKAPVKKS
ncbi:MAG: type I DNA topoisomerase, partial [Candidatus Saccharimonadales bacterium]